MIEPNVWEIKCGGMDVSFANNGCRNAVSCHAYEKSECDLKKRWRQLSDAMGASTTVCLTTRAVSYLRRLRVLLSSAGHRHLFLGHFGLG